MPVDLDQSTLKSAIEDNDMVIVDFWAPWCAPCRGFAPVYEEVAQNHADVVFGKVNTQEHEALAAGFQVRSIPTLMVFRERILVFNQPGAISKPDLEKLVVAVKSLDMNAVRDEIAQQDKPSANPAK